MKEVKKDKRTQVIETALKLFTSQGLQQTSMAQISKESGVAVGTIYLNFKSKDELIEGVFMYVKENFGSYTHLSEQEMQLPFEEQFKKIGEKSYQFYVQNPHYFFFIEMSNNLPIISDEIREKSKVFYQQAINVLMSGMQSGKIKEIHPNLLFRMVYGSITALIQLKLNDKINVTKEMINQAFNIILKGLQ